MWGSWFGKNDVVEQAEIIVPPKEVVYLIEGTLRVPLELPNHAKRDFRAIRQWVFETIARLPLEENVEYYTFKVLPNDYVYWYSLYESKTNDSQGILMKFDPVVGAFTGATDPDEELPQIQVPKGGVVQEDKSIVEHEDNNNKACEIELIASAINSNNKKRLPSKRNRTRK